MFSCKVSLEPGVWSLEPGTWSIEPIAPCSMLHALCYMLYSFYKVAYLLTYRATTRGPSGPKNEIYIGHFSMASTLV